MLTSLLFCLAVAPAPKNIVVVMTDGLRWQEVYQGADKALIDPLKDRTIKQRFWRDTVEARREALMPFYWSVVAKQGQVYGNQALGSVAQVANPLKFTFPGFNETVSGYPDPRVSSNEFNPNPNVSVFEWLNKKPEYKGRTAAFGASEIISFVLNHKRCGFTECSGYAPLTEGKSNAEIRQLNRVKAEFPRLWDDEPYDTVAFHTALEYTKLNRPRVLFLALGETDEWAHEKKYDLYLTAANRFDAYLKELWETLQSMPQYRNNTILALSCDHGRGAGSQWDDHGDNIPGSEGTFIAFMGSGVAPLGEMKQVPTVTNSQMAATLARLVGYDFNQFQPKAGRPISAVAP